MQEINVAELRKHTKACFDAVEQGDVLIKISTITDITRVLC